MNLTETEYRRIVKSIEHQRYLVIDTLLRAYPYSSFDGGVELSRNQEFNELYKLLDEAITKEELKKKLSNMPHMAQCAWCAAKNNLEWHHAIQYSGKQLNEWYAIIALCRQCHRGEFGTLRAEIKDFCELLAITRGAQDIIKNYPKRDWLWDKQWLEQKVIRYMNDKKI